MAFACQETKGKYDAGRSGKVKVTILASEWGSSKGDFSTLIRNLAIQLAKSSDVEISFFVPQCSERDKTEALSCNIRIIEATKRVGFEGLDLLSYPPCDLQIDVVIGHGVELGRHAEIIREYRQCKWVQVVHTDPEEMAMFKGYTDSISKGEEKHKNEVKLCEMADFVVVIGPKLAEAFCSYLRPFGNEQTVFDLTPGIFEEFLSVEQVPEERKHRSVLVLSRGDAEDFKLKGFDIAGKAIASLADTLLIFVGAPDGKHGEIAESLMQCGLPANRLRVRGYEESRESLKRLFCEVDLLLMPSRTEGFGLIGLEALSAGLPVLVSKNSGFGEALCKVLYGSFFVIDSVYPDVWAVNIKNIIWDKGRQNRLEEAKGIRKSYQKKYSWAKQSDDLLARISSLVRAHPQIDIGSVRKGTEMGEPQEVIHERREPSTTKKQQVVGNTSFATENGGNVSIQSTQAVLNRIVYKYLQHVCPSNVEQFIDFVVYLEKVRKELVLDPIKPGSLVPTVEVGSEEILEEVWKDHHKEGHLNEMAQKLPAIRELLEEYRLILFKLTTLIAEEQYKAFKRDLSGLNADREVGINIAVTDDLGAGKSNFINTLRDHSDLANAVVDSIYSGDGGTWQATEQSQLMGTGANQANGLSDAVVGSDVQTAGSSQSNQPSDPPGGPNNGLDQSGSAERGGATSDRRLADMTIEQASGRNYPVMGLDVQQVIPNCHAASEYVSRVPSGEGAQQINGLPGNHEEEAVAEEADGLSINRVERAWQACEMSFLDHANGGNCRPYGTAAREALPFPIREDATCLPVQEQGDGYAAPQAPILLPHVLPGEANLVSSMGNTANPTVHCCSTEEINQWMQQITRSNPQTAVLKMGNAHGTFFIMKIEDVAQRRRYETPILSDAVYSYRFGRLMGIRIYPNGVGSGRGTHVAIFIHLMKSTFDDLLDWPYDGTITVSVLHRRGARGDIRRIIQAKPNLLAFQQPHGTICRTGYGYERFAQIQEFFAPRYVKDDELLVKIELSRL